jgi:hypothetical protein
MFGLYWRREIESCSFAAPLVKRFVSAIVNCLYDTLSVVRLRLERMKQINV